MEILKIGELVDDEDLDAPWPAIFSADLWGILNRLNVIPADRDLAQYQFKLAFQEAINREGSFGIAAKLDGVKRAATYRRPTERLTLTRAALAEVWGSSWYGFIDELLDS